MTDRFARTLYVVVDAPTGTRVEVYSDEETARQKADGFTNLIVLTYHIESVPAVTPAAADVDLLYGEHPEQTIDVGASDEDVVRRLLK